MPPKNPPVAPPKPSTLNLTTQGYTRTCNDKTPLTPGEKRKASPPTGPKQGHEGHDPMTIRPSPPPHQTPAPSPRGSAARRRAPLNRDAKRLGRRRARWPDRGGRAGGGAKAGRRTQENKSCNYSDNASAASGRRDRAA